MTSLPSSRLQRDLTEPEPIPEAGIARAVALMRSGRLFRYGEFGADQSDAAQLEVEFAALVQRQFCIAVNSGGSALFLALKAAGVATGDAVLLNGFTLAPVPGAIVHAGARPVIVDIGPDYIIDIADLRRKAQQSGARFLLLSHMRGHIADMDAVGAVCAEFNLHLIEDCAHALMATWRGKPLGSFGCAAAFSAQTYKHLNAGEGGFLVTDDGDIAARAILHSGSYMLYRQHASRPDQAAFEALEGAAPNFSLRMTALAAALLRPQLQSLPARAARWRKIHDRIAAGLARSQWVRLPQPLPLAAPAPTSIQFSLRGLAQEDIARVIGAALERGVPIKWFGAARQSGFTSAPRHWNYAGGQDDLTQTHDVLASLCDIRTPVSLSDAECDLVAAIVNEAIESVVSDATEVDGKRRHA